MDGHASCEDASNKMSLVLLLVMQHYVLPINSGVISMNNFDADVTQHVIQSSGSRIMIEQSKTILRHWREALRDTAQIVMETHDAITFKFYCCAIEAVHGKTTKINAEAQPFSSVDIITGQGTCTYNVIATVQHIGIQLVQNRVILAFLVLMYLIITNSRTCLLFLDFEVVERLSTDTRPTKP